MLWRYILVLSAAMFCSHALIYEMTQWHDIQDASKMYSILEQVQNVVHCIQLPPSYSIIKGEENVGTGSYVWYKYTLEINNSPCVVVVFIVRDHNQDYTAIEQDTCGVKVDKATPSC